MKRSYVIVSHLWIFMMKNIVIFSDPNLALAVFPLTNAVGEIYMFATYALAAQQPFLLSEFAYKHLYDIHHVYSKWHYCECSSLGCIETIKLSMPWAS